jgi:hypothetical protein
MKHERIYSTDQEGLPDDPALTRFTIMALVFSFWAAASLIVITLWLVGHKAEISKAVGKFLFL